MDVTKVVGFDLRIPKHFSFHFSDFSKILYGIYKFAVFENKRKRKRTFASRPLELCFLLTRGPWSDQEQRKVGRPCSGEERHRRRMLGWGKMERASRTTYRRPWVAGRRLEEAAPRRGAAGGELSHGGGALVRDGGGGRAWEHPGKVEKAMECSIWALEDRGWWFHGELARGGGHGVRRRPLAGEGLMLGSGVQWEVREGAAGLVWSEEK